MFKEKKIETLKFDPSKICPLIKRREYFPEHTVVSQKLPCPLLWTDYTEKNAHTCQSNSFPITSVQMSININLEAMFTGSYVHQV